MPKLTERDSWHGSVQAGRWNENDEVVHVQQKFSLDGDGFEGAGMRHPRHVYVNFGKPLQKSPLNDGRVNPTIVDLAEFDPVASTAPVADIEESTPVVLTIEMINLGSATWDNTYDLVPLGANNFGFIPVAVTGTVIPGAAATFAMSGTSPVGASIENVQFQMRNGAATLFSAPTDFIQINVHLAGTGGLYPIDAVIEPDLKGTYTADYAMAGFDSDGKLLLVSETVQATALPDLAINDPMVEIQWTSRGGVREYKLYRMASTFPAGWPEASIGRIHSALFFPSDVAGQPAGGFDVGNSADTTDTLPPNQQLSKNSKNKANAAANPSLILPNVIDGARLDGSTGGQIINGELVFDFVDNEFPENINNWPAADWPRNFRGIITGAASVFVRVYGIDGWSDRLGVRFEVLDTFAGDLNHTRYAFKRIKRIYIESTDPNITLWMGWAAGLGVPYPVHPRQFQDDATKTDEQRGTARFDYHPTFYRRGRELTTDSTTGIRNKLQFYPIQYDPRGIWRPTDEPDGLNQYETEYYAERLDSNQQKYWQSQKEAGALDGILLPDREDIL